MLNQGVLPKKDGIASVTKAMQILSCFDVHHKELSLADLAKMTGHPKTTVFGFVRSLEKENLLVRCASSDNYRLGTRMLELSYFAKAAIPIIQIAAPLLNRISLQSGQNVYLTTHSNGRLLYLDSVYRDKEYIGYSETGKVLPMHCTASGKAMLAWMTDEQRTAIFAAYPMMPITPNTITNPDVLNRQLEEIREVGYAIDNAEEDPGVCCLAMAILDQNDHPVGAVSISGSASDMTDDKMQEYAMFLSDHAAKLRLHANLFPCRPLMKKE